MRTLYTLSNKKLSYGASREAQPGLDYVRVGEPTTDKANKERGLKRQTVGGIHKGRGFSMRHVAPGSEVSTRLPVIRIRLARYGSA